MNDRALRQVVVGLGGVANGYLRETRFDITVASEIMAVFCLATDMSDLQARLKKMIVGLSKGRKPVTAEDLQAVGSIAVLLRDALEPNLVQTLEGTPAFIHGGPFANIAHGCNSVIATNLALDLADYVVTEAGFGADLGAEKFFDIKCRQAGLEPQAAVIVATVRALKMHGGVAKADLGKENLEALHKGMANLGRHIENVKTFGVAEKGEAKLKPLYALDQPIAAKMRTIATEIYRAADIAIEPKAKKAIADIEALGHGNLPICVAKTQYSFSANPAALGAPTGHVVPIVDARLSAGAGFVVLTCGDIMTLPGLPESPSAHRIKLDDKGQIEGLF
jgi:formate--tetrahydrofolate ligase